MTVEVEISGRNMEVTDRINDYVTRKFPGWIGSYLGSMKHAWIWRM